MEDTWLCIDENDALSHHSFSDSDAIDSEIEAELYSIIHYEENLMGIKCHSSESGNVQDSESCIPTSNKMNEFCSERNRQNVQTESSIKSNLSSPSTVDSDENMKSPNENAFINKLAQKLSTGKKKKSNSMQNVSNIVCSDDSKDTGINECSKHLSLNNKRKRKSNLSLLINSSPVKKNNTAIIDSSDSDSISWTETDLTDKKDIKINVFKDIDAAYLISSDSDTEADVSLSKRESTRNLSMPNIKIGERSKDLWFVNNEDLLRRKQSNSRRYHNSFETTCSNCNGRGHVPRTCPMPKAVKCFICGGAHLVSQCGNRVCGKCYSTGHDSKKCWMPRINYCTLCSMKGHIKENCPDLWRRYHLTTKPGKIVHTTKEIKRHSIPYCCNCGEPGHFGAVCKFSRTGKNCFPTWPCVVSYEDPEELLRKRLNGQKARRGYFRKDAHLNLRNELNVAKDFIAETKNEKKKKKEIKKALREKDFPRTAKTNTLPNDSANNVPETVDYILYKREKRRLRNIRRKLKRRQKQQKLLEKKERKKALREKDFPRTAKTNNFISNILQVIP